MATLDLQNDIAPQHSFRPVKTALSELRRGIRTALPSVYSQAYVDNLNRNDLVAIYRAHNLRLPFPGIPSQWTATTAKAIGDQVMVTGPGLLEATTAGTTAGSAPANPGSVGGTVVDGGVTWKRIS